MKLLMHMCCAPCAVYPVSVLRDEGVEVHGLFYNPNIHPWDEYVRRRDTVVQYAELVSMPVTMMEGFDEERWRALASEELARCTMCYTVRMDRVAEYAAINGYDAFTTSLLVSPYQKHELIAKAAHHAGARAGIAFLYRDFRPGFREGQNMAKEMGLYRQKYCGCIVSYEERLQELAEKEQRKALRAKALS